MTLKQERVNGGSLWPWLAAAMFAPACQSLGSAPWPWTLALALGAMAVFLCAQMVTAPGWPCGKVLAAAEYLFLVLCVGMVADWVDECWLGAKSGWVIPVVVLVLAACAADRGAEKAGRSGATLFWFVAMGFVVLAVFALPDVEVSNLYPGRMNSYGADIGVLLIPGAALLLSRQRGKEPWPWALGIAVSAGLISVLTAGSLSPAVAAKTPGAFVQMVRGLEILGVAERFEALVAAIMTLGWFSLLSLLLTGAGEMGNKIHAGNRAVPVWTAAGLGAGIFLVGKRISMWPMAALAAILWYGIPVTRALLARRKKQ